MAKLEEKFCVFQGDNIIACVDTRKKADTLFDALPKPTRPSQKRAIYKLVREDVQIKKEE